MAELLAHPDKDIDFSKFSFDLKIGRVVLQTYGGKRMTEETALFLLSQATQIILHDSLTE